MTRPTVSGLRRAVSPTHTWSWDALREHLVAVSFRWIVYTRIGEDPRMDADALRPNETSRIVTISSAGCNILKYLTHAPERILAVDVNAVHLAVTCLKITALRHCLRHDAFFQFVGVGAGRQNVQVYPRHLRPHLRDSTRKFWESRSFGGLRRSRVDAFEEGFYEPGIFLRFRRLASLLSRWLQGRRAEELLDASSRDERQRFFESCWEDTRCRLRPPSSVPPPLNSVLITIVLCPILPPSL